MSGWLRLGHWLFVCCIVLAWFTRHGGGAWHEWPGYMALVLASFRVAQCSVGRGSLQFDLFARGPNVLLEYLKKLWREPHLSVGGDYKPLSGYLVVVLLGLGALTGVSGWLQTTDHNWGLAWIGTAHNLLATALVITAVLHGVEILSRRTGKAPS